ncbi:MAG: MarR family transcriptional regulator [Acidimicrobiia bacterium]
MPTKASSSLKQRPADQELAGRLRLAVARLHRRMRQSADSGLTISQLSTLATIDQQGPMTLGALARVEQVQPPTVTALTAKLEAAGLVVRTIDPDDRRIHRVAMSPAGTKLLAQHRNRKNAFLDRRLRQLSDTDREVLSHAAAIMERLAQPEPGTGRTGSA